MKLIHIKISLLSLMAMTMQPSQAFSLNDTSPKKQTGLYDNRSCQQLYYTASELESHSMNFESDIYNQQNNDIASIVSTVFTPALYFLGYSKIVAFQSDRKARESTQELDKVRHKMAEMRCFQR